MSVYLSPPVHRIAMLSVHTCPLALMGGKKTGGMNVYVRDFSRELGCHGVQVDVFTRSQDSCRPAIVHDLGPGGRVIHIPAGPETPIPLAEVENYLDEFVDGVLRFAAVEGIRYDLIHSHYWLSGMVAEQAARAGRHAHRSDVSHPRSHEEPHRADERTGVAVALDGEAHIVAIADRLIAATPAEEAQLINLYG